MPPYTVVASMDQQLAHNWGNLASPLANMLPYSNALSAEAAEMLNDIIHHFNICLQAEDWAPGAAFWAKQLNKYLDLKYILPLETRVSFARIFFELTIAPGMEASLVEHWARYCMRLIKKKKLIGPKDLTLPWRPLYDLLERVLFTKNRQRALLSESKRMNSVVQLVGHAQRFFPQTASREILEEFLPRFSTGDLPELLKAQSYLSTFLPTHNLQTMKPQEWLPTIFKVWTMVMRSNDFDRNFLSLIARTAEDNVGTYPFFSQSQIRAVFSAGMRTVDLPVGSNTRSAGTVDVEIGALHRAVARQDIRLRMFAKFIVYTINPRAEADSPADSSLAHLSDMIQATESFYHPSNLGNWTGPLASFVQTLAWEWLKRLNDEKEESCKTPHDLRLTSVLSDKFVEIIRGVTFLLMFSKDRQSVSHSHEALRLLAWIAPTKVIPGVLERAYPSLESLTESHRTTSVISALGALALPMLNRDNFPQGGKHLAPLLQLTIPGIDPNDPVKSLVTMMFVASSIMTVPVHDLSSASAGGSPIDWGGMEEESFETGEMVDMELEDAKRRASTIEFEEWLAKFLRRIIVLFENFPDDNIGSGRGAMEKSLQSTVTYTFDIVFNNLSPQLRERAAKAMVDFISETPLTNASKATSMLISTWASTYREACLEKIWSICEREIRSEIEHGASSIPSVTYSDIQRDKTLFFYQQVLNKAVSSSEVLGHRQEIISLATYVIDKCQGRRGFQLGARLLGCAMSSLLSICPINMRAYDSEQLNDSAWITESHKYWGQIAEPGVDQIEWFIPTTEHIAYALELMDLFLVPAIAKARDIMANYKPTNGHGNGTHVSIELCKTLTVLKAFVKTIINLVDDDGDSPISKSQPLDEIGSTAPNKPLEVMYLLKDKADPRAIKMRKIRNEIGEVLHQLMAFFSESREDDVENIKLLVKTTGIFMSNRGVDRADEDSQRRGYLYLKRTVAMPGDRKLMCRMLRLRRAYTLHLQRLRLNAGGRPKTVLHDMLLEDLAELSLGRYTEVRKAAQQALIKSIKCYQGAKALVLPRLLKALESDNQDSDRMKGALFLLSTRSLILPLLRDWKYAPDYITRLINAHHQDKPSIQLLIRKNFMEYLTNMTNLSLRVLVGTTLLQARSQFAAAHRLEADHSHEVASRLAAKVKTRRLNDIKALDNLLVFLTESARSTTLHWRYQTMAISVLEILNRPEIAPSADLAEYYTRAVLSEMSPIRRIALSSLTSMMTHIKLRSFAGGDVYSLIVRKSSNPLRRTVTLPETLPDDFTWEYLKKSVTEIDYAHPESSLLDDSVATGWSVWPKTFKAYLPRADDFEFPAIEADSQGAYAILDSTFGQQAFWESLLGFMSQEPARGEAHDVFSSEHARLFKSIFGLWEDQFLFDLVAPIVEKKLCQQSDDKNCQRAAAEFMAGLIRGSKHWRKASLDKMWGWAIPVLKRTLHSCTPDALGYWERFVHYACAQRDPRRVLPLITLIFGTPLDIESTAAFSEAKNLFFTNAVRVRCSWRISSLTPSLRETLLGQVAHPYKQVREILGIVLDGLFQDAFHPSYNNVSELLEDHQTHQPENVESSRLMLGLDERHRRQIAALKESLEKWRAERVPSAHGSSAYSNAGKTVLSWMNAALSGARIQATYGLLYPLFSEVLQMQDVADDQDLQQLATIVLWKMAKLVFPPSYVPDLVELFCKTLNVATTSNWHIRNNLLPVVQIFFFTNLFSMRVDMMVQVMDAISGMLLDPQIEVRQLAAKTLAGIVRCSQRDATQKLISNFETLLSTPLPSRKRAREARSTESSSSSSNAVAADAIGKKAPQTEGYTDAVVKRHAGVLGLAALLEAFPYEVPSWMPSVMVRLADFQADPPPISTTVKKAFADFRRTHQDTWHEDQKMFDYDQLEVLSNMLISPSYYA